MTHFRVANKVFITIPSAEIAAWLDTPGFLEVCEDLLEPGEELTAMKPRLQKDIVIICDLEITTPGPSARELDLKENGVPFV